MWRAIGCLAWLGLVEAAFAPAAAQTKSNGLVATVHPSEWVLSDDYPMRALVDEAEGTTYFVLAVNFDGTPASCKITRSSGHRLLDISACDHIMLRARFRPYKPVAKRGLRTYHSAVRWVMPRELTPQPRTVTFGYDVDTDGRMVDCRVESHQEPRFFNIDEIDSPCEGYHRYDPFRDAKGHPVRKHVRRTVTIEIADPPSATPPQP